MTTDEKRIFLQELYQANMTRPQMERYLASSLRLTPVQWMEMLADIKGTIESPENSQDKPISNDELNDFLQETFPE